MRRPILLLILFWALWLAACAPVSTSPAGAELVQLQLTATAQAADLQAAIGALEGELAGLYAGQDAADRERRLEIDARLYELRLQRQIENEAFATRTVLQREQAVAFATQAAGAAAINAELDRRVEIENTSEQARLDRELQDRWAWAFVVGFLLLALFVAVGTYAYLQARAHKVDAERRAIEERPRLIDSERGTAVIFMGVPYWLGVGGRVPERLLGAPPSDESGDDSGDVIDGDKPPNDSNGKDDASLSRSDIVSVSPMPPRLTTAERNDILAFLDACIAASELGPDGQVIPSANALGWRSSSKRAGYVKLLKHNGLVISRQGGDTRVADGRTLGWLRRHIIRNGLAPLPSPASAQVLDAIPA